VDDMEYCLKLSADGRECVGQGDLEGSVASMLMEDIYVT